MKPRALVAPALGVAFLGVAFVGCARVGLPPGKEATEDDKPPRLKKVETVDANHLELTFSEPMDETTLRERENYAVVDEAGEPLPVAAAVVTRPDAVVVVTSAQDAGARYELVTRNVADATGGNRIEKDNAKGFKGSRHADDKPPAVAATYPADGAAKVGLHPEILVEFTDVMAEDAAAAVEVYDDFGENVPGEATVDGYWVRFRPTARLDFATRYQVVVADACADLAGNVLYREQRFGFTTLEDADEGVVKGKARVLEEGVSPAGLDVRLSLSPDPLATGVKVVGHATADAEGNFVLGGIPPNTETEASYYLVATLDADGDGEPEYVGGYSFAGGKAGALPTFLGGDRIENVEVVLTTADVEGPTVGKVVISPDPTAGQDALYLRAAFADVGGSPIAGAEVFFDEVWSDGTGLALTPVEGEWNAGPRAEGACVVFDLGRRHVNKKGEHHAYVHAVDAAGNWGDVVDVPFTVSGAPRGGRRIAGEVVFEKLPAPAAVVAATPAGGDAPAAFAIADKKGLYKLEDLPPGRYDLVARLDEDGDGRWRPGEPSGGAGGVVNVMDGDAEDVMLVMTYAPALTAANARLQNYAAAGAEPRAVLTVSTTVRDRDLDLKRVWAVLPDGEELELLDDGVPPDDAAGDGIYTFSRSWRGADVAAVPEGDVVVYAEDGQGNRATAAAAANPGLRITKLEPPASLAVDATADGLNVSWAPVAGAGGGYVVFLIPADRLARFTEPGTGDVFSNFANPVFDTALAVPFAAVQDWWAYPAGSRFVVMLVASAGDAPAFGPADKAIMTTEWVKPAGTPAGAGGAGGRSKE